MKVSILVTILTFLLFPYFGSAQYYRTTVIGNTPKNLNKDRVNNKLDIDPDWTTIHSNPTAAAWSSIQTLPFTFLFNGSPVDSYKVSSTGVLTFNTETTIIPGAIPTALPSASIPDNSICLWGMKPNIAPTWASCFISHKTFGKIGNRQYWVMFSFCPNGTIARSTWSIVLEESSNNIYLVEQWNGAGGVSALSVGIQINSSLAFSDPLSPSVPVFSKYNFLRADDKYHRFAPGIRPQVDIELIDFNMPYFTTPGNKAITGTIHNVGTNTVTNLDVTWNDGSGPVSEKISVNIAPDSIYTFNCSNQWNAQAGPQKLITLTVTTTGDLDSLNNAYEIPVTVLTNTPKKYVVLEERTGTWCGYCPSSAIGMAQLELDLGSDFIGIAVHSSDPMEISSYDRFGTYIKGGGHPSLVFDRVDESGFIGSTTLLKIINNRKAFAVPCEIKNLSKSINSLTNTINISCETEWIGDIHGDYRLSCVIVEDDLVGTSSSWFQANAFAGGSSGPAKFPSNVNNGFDFAQAQNPANPSGWGGFDHVARYLSKGDLLGNPNSLPPGEVPMGTHSYTFEPIPPSVVKDINKSYAIVMIVDEYTGDILNAKKISLSNFPASIDDLKEKVNIEVYPNPAQDLVHISVDSKKTISKVSIALTDILGNEVRRISSIENNIKVTLNTESLSNGMYFINLVIEEGTIAVKKIFITR
jgi:hypothetical protein